MSAIEVLSALVFCICILAVWLPRCRALGIINQQSSPVFDVTRFGAAGDGVTDDTRAIASASAAASARGGMLIFPTGTYIFNPTKAKVLVGSNMTIRGPGTLKVKAECGGYQYIIGASDPRMGLTNVILDGLTVDQNIEQNRTLISTSDPKTFQCIFLSWHITTLVVRNCKFDASGVNTIVANPATESALFENNTFIFHKRSDQPAFDNSAIYFSGPRAVASKNSCHAALSARAVTCIELHDGDVKVRDNAIDGYEIGMNIVDVIGASIENNTGTALEYGALIWATARHASRNVVIAANDFSIDNVERDAPGSGGIATYYGEHVTGMFDGIVIKDNHITFQPEVQPRFVEYPRSNWGISTQAFGPVRNVLIANNKIANAPVRGIKIGQIEMPPLEPLQSNIFVESNKIVNAGYNSDASVAPYRAAIAVEGRLENVTIRNNTIVESAVRPGVYSIWFAIGHGPYADVAYYGQQVTPQQGLLQVISPEIRRGK